MILPIPVSSDYFHLMAISPTAVEPGEKLEIHLELQALQDITLTGMDWKTLEGITTGQNPASPFPVALAAGHRWKYIQTFLTQPVRETFGEIEGTLRFQPGTSSEPAAQSWKNWISVFPLARPDAGQPLSDELRARLIAVGTANPHIFLADFVSFFEDYLNINLPEKLVPLLIKDFALPGQGLPVDHETYLLFCQRLKSFYGIEELILIPEEECNESDDRFDPDELKETTHPDITLDL